LGNSIIEIGNSAFNYCKKINNIVLPEKLQAIGSSAFEKCEALTDITLPESLLRIEDEAFSECDLLESIEIPQNVEYIGYGAFSKRSAFVFLNNSSSLQEVTIRSYNCVIEEKGSAIWDTAAFAKNTVIKACSGSTAESFATTNKNTFVSIGHVLDDVEIVKEPTCTGMGKQRIRCSVCGQVDSVNMIPATGHNFDSGAITEAPTCTTDGIKTFTCKNDPSHVYTTIISATGHSFSDDQKYCLNGCGTINPDYIDPAHTHAWGSGNVISEASCSSSGLKEYTCSICNETYTETLPRLEHSYELTEVKEATCSTAGSLTYVCSACGDTYSTTIPATREHQYEPFTVRENSCTMTGIVTHTCSVCGDSYTESVPMKAHDYVSSIEKEATCKATGMISYTCSVCGDSYTQSIPMKEHSYDMTVGRAATCKVTGINNYVCSVCGDSYSETVPKIQHKYKTVTTKATLNKDGVISDKCESCGDVKSSVIIYYPKTVSISASSVVYNKKAITPTVTVKDSSGQTVSAENYSVVYSSGRKAIGIYDVVIKFSGNYSGEVTKTFSIVPKKTKIKYGGRLKDGSLAIKWKKTKPISGYEVQVSTNKKFKKSKTYTAKAKSKSARISKGIKSNKKYFIRIRTFKTVKYNGKKIKIYGSWSKTKAIKPRG